MWINPEFEWKNNRIYSNELILDNTRSLVSDKMDSYFIQILKRTINFQANRWIFIFFSFAHMYAMHWYIAYYRLLFSHWKGFIELHLFSFFIFSLCYYHGKHFETETWKWNEKCIIHNDNLKCFSFKVKFAFWNWRFICMIVKNVQLPTCSHIIQALRSLCMLALKMPTWKTETMLQRNAFPHAHIWFALGWNSAECLRNLKQHCGHICHCLGWLVCSFVRSCVRAAQTNLKCKELQKQILCCGSVH